MATTDRKDPLQHLTRLRQDIPGWLERVEKLTETANERYAQWIKESQLSEKPPSLKKARSGSVESLRPLDDGEKIPSPAVSPEPEGGSPTAVLQPQADNAADVSLKPLQSQPTTPPAGKVDIDPHNRHLFREIREQRRKRKNPSANDGASGPPRFRVRGNFTIWYDSSIQAEFEGLVRNISGARHILRKAKTAASFRIRLGSFKSDESSQEQHAHAHPYQARSVPRLSQPGNSYLTGLKTGLETYETVDKELESAQTLCEVGAHQFLRDADCFDELDGTKTRFEKCLELIVAEIKSLEDQNKLDSATTTSSLQSSQGKAKTSDRLLKRSLSSLDPDAIRIDGPLEADENADQESIEIDLMALPGRRHYSSRHLMMNAPGVRSGGATHSGTLPGNANYDSVPEKATPVSNPSSSKNSSNRNSTDMETSLVDNILVDSGINVPTSESEKTDDDTDFDPKAMRKDSTNRFSMASTSRSDTKDTAAPAIAPAKDEVELDLWAMRHSVGYRDKAAVPEALAMDRIETLVSQIHDVNKVENSNMDVPIFADVMVGDGPGIDIAPDPEPELDLTAMRGAIGRRGPGKSDATIKGRQDIKPDEESASSETAKGLEIGSPDVSLSPDFAVDSGLAVAPDDEATVDIPDNIADMLKNIRKTSRV